MLRRSRGAAALRRTAAALGAEQLQDMPDSTPRRPTRPHRGPLKRMVSEAEKAEWRFVRQWELRMQGAWDDNEPFRHLPKPKKLMGNEAASIVWPYAVLLENRLRINRFTKSVYVYYPQRTLTDAGARAAASAKRFAQQCLVPLTFHNPQCYVEAELLVEFGDTPWVVVNCIDGRHTVLHIAAPPAGASDADAKAALLAEVQRAADGLAAGIADVPAALRALNERPNQNGFVRVDYQWLGDSAEERAQHTMEWSLAAADGRDPATGQSLAPGFMGHRSAVSDWLAFDGGRSLSPEALAEVRMSRKSARQRAPAGKTQFFNATTRHTAAHARFDAAPANFPRAR